MRRFIVLVLPVLLVVSGMGAMFTYASSIVRHVPNIGCAGNDNCDGFFPLSASCTSPNRMDGAAMNDSHGVHVGDVYLYESDVCGAWWGTFVERVSGAIRSGTIYSTRSFTTDDFNNNQFQGYTSPGVGTYNDAPVVGCDSPVAEASGPDDNFNAAVDWVDQYGAHLHSQPVTLVCTPHR